jgi:hypothetical protein
VRSIKRQICLELRWDCILEIFQGSQPVLAGVDAASTYCYLLQGVEHRDGETWGWHLLDVMEQGFQPDFTIADAGTGLRAGQKEVLPDTPSQGDVFHLQQQFETVVNILNRQAASATAQRMKLEQKLAQAKLKGQKTRPLKCKLNVAHQREQKLVMLTTDVNTLLGWMSHDILELAEPLLAVRQDLFDFIVAELKQRECKAHPQLQTLRKSLHHQREQVLAFAGLQGTQTCRDKPSTGLFRCVSRDLNTRLVPACPSFLLGLLDQKLAEIALGFEVPLQTVRSCLPAQS